jgi:hypothetical protein
MGGRPLDLGNQIDLNLRRNRRQAPIIRRTGYADKKCRAKSTKSSSMVLRQYFYRPPATTFEGMKAHFSSITRIFGWNLKNILSNQNRY